MLFIAFDCMAAANAQESVKHMILYGDKAKNVWDTYNESGQDKKYRFYGTDAIFIVPFNKVTVTILDSLTIATDMSITVPSDNITGVILDKKIIDALGLEFVSVSLASKKNSEEVTEILLTVPLLSAKAVKLRAGYSKLTTPLLDAKITVTIPDKLKSSLSLDNLNNLSCLPKQPECNITNPKADIIAKVPAKIDWINEPNDTIKLPEINMKIHLETIIWSCFTPCPSTFLGNLLIRKAGDVVICSIDQSAL